MSLPIDIVFELFEKVVSPILLYASEVYGSDNIKSIDVFQRSFYKRILRLSKATPTVMIYGETGTVPLSITIEKRIIGYWLQLISADQSKLNSIIYKFIHKLDYKDIYCTKWLSKVKSILKRCGLYYIWIDQEYITDIDIIKTIVNIRIDDIYEQTWHASLPTHIRCSSYVIYKEERKIEMYLLKLNANERINLDV